jgi:hypothetical protein
VEDKEAASVVSLPNKVVPFLHLAEIEFVNQQIPYRLLEVAECKVGDE